MLKNPSIIKDAIVNMGGTIEEFLPERGCFYINVLGKRMLIERKISISRESFVSRELTRSKDITHKLLQQNNLPTPQTNCFYKKSFERISANEKLGELSYPVILKDAKGSNSKGIFPFINCQEDALATLEKELPHYQSMIAQEMVQGKEYRILILGDKVIGALEMIPPYVVGDGTSSIQEIIEKKQLTTERKTSLNETLNDILEEQNVHLQTVLPTGKTVYIKKSSCLAEGGETRDLTAMVHPKIRDICVAASKVVGKNLVGIDVMCEGISKNPHESEFNILEINGKPDLYIHYDPTHGKTQNVVEDIVKFMVATA